MAGLYVVHGKCRHTDDIDQRLHARGFHVHKWILCDKMVSMASRLYLFDVMITSVVCSAAGHRRIYTNNIRQLDVHCRKFFRRLVGPPADTDRNQPWHTMLHAWHRRIGLINNWNTIVVKCGQRNFCPTFGNVLIMWLYLMTVAGRNAFCIGTQEVESLDAHFSNGKLHYKIFAAGITWAPGLTSPETTISGSNTIPTPFPLSGLLLLLCARPSQSETLRP